MKKIGIESLRGKIALIAGVITIVLLVYSDVAFGGSRTFMSWYDNTVQYHPWMTYLVKEWRHFSPPLWDFSDESGTSFIGELQTGVFYPANILYAWIVGNSNPHWLDWFLLLHMMYCGLGAVALFRKIGLSGIASVMGGVTISIVGPIATRAYAQANIYVGLCHLPWVLYFLHASLLEREWPRILLKAMLAGLFLGISLLAGHPQPFIHGSILMLIWTIAFLFFDRSETTEFLRKIRKNLVVISVAIGFSLLVGYIQLAASNQYFNLALRWVGLDEPVSALQVVPYEAYKLYPLKVTDISELIWPTHCIADSATISVTLTALVFGLFGLWHNNKVKWLGSFLVCFGLLLALGDATFMGKIVYHTPWLNKVRQPVRALLFYHVGISLLAALGADLVFSQLARHKLLQITCVIGVFSLFIVEAKFCVEIPLFHTSNPQSAQSFNQPTDLTRFLDSLSKETGDFYRVLILPKDIIPPNPGLLHSFHSVLGARSSMLSAYFRYLCMDWSIESKGWDNLGVRYLVSNTTRTGVKELAFLNGMHIYERPNPRPVIRAESTISPESFQSPESIAWGSNQVKAKFKSLPGNSRVVFAQTTFPGWRAYVNGRRVAVDKKGIFSCVKVSKGDADICFVYSPPWIGYGLGCWILAGMSLGGVIYWRRRQLNEAFQQNSQSHTVVLSDKNIFENATS